MAAKVVSIEKYRKVLLSKKAEFMAVLAPGHTKVTNRERTSEEDLAPVAHDEFIRTGTQQVVTTQLRQVESAIHRLEKGEYGICAECGDEIASKRLNAVPWTKYCISCQERIAA
jgi:DnaK suppressor protein